MYSSKSVRKTLLLRYDSNNDSSCEVLKKPEVIIRVSTGLASTQSVFREWSFR